MKNIIKTLLFIPFAFLSCFIGADTYEKDVNEYFWLYSHDYSTSNVSLGTIEHGYRLGDGYLHGIKQIGWDQSFMIIRTHSGKYYIQDFRNLKNKPIEDFKRYLYGPLSKLSYDSKRDALHVDENLHFELTYD